MLEKRHHRIVKVDEKKIGFMHRRGAIDEMCLS